MQRVEVAARLADIAGAAHDRQADYAAPRRQALMHDHGGRPEENGGEPESIAEQLRRAQPETIGELAEDAQRAEATCRADDECHPGRTSIADRRTHAAILETGRNYWTRTGT